MLPQQHIYEYSGYNGAPSNCRFTFSKTVTGLTVCVVDELPTNRGTRIREFAEHLATHAYRDLFAPSSLHLHEFLYVEHAPVPPSFEYSYSLVDFDWDDDGKQFIRPRRTSLTAEELETLLGKHDVPESEPSATALPG